MATRIHTITISQTARANHLRSERPRRVKSANVLITDPDGVPKGSWTDVAVPSFARGIDGADGLTLFLNREYGRLDEPGEPGSGGTLRPGNHIQVWVSDPETDVEQHAPFTWGVSTWGASPWGLSVDGVRVWTGTIEHVRVTPPAGAIVECLPMDRVLAQAPVLSFQASGDPVQIARQVLDTYAPAVLWAGASADTSGLYGEFAWQNATVAAIVEDCRAYCGPTWFTAVTPAGTLLFRDLDASAEDGSLAQHTLYVGTQVTGAEFERDQRGRAKRVIVVGANGFTGDAQAADYDARDPRAAYVSATHLQDAGSCQRLATLELEARDRVVLSGRCTVWDTAYDVESIELGDALRLITPRPSDEPVMPLTWGYGQWGSQPWGVAGYADYNQPLVVVRLAYAVHSVTVELQSPRPNVARQVAAMLRETARLGRTA